MANESTTAKQARVKKIIATLNRTHPDAKLALNFASPLELLVALILAAQARDELVNAVTEILFKKYRTADDWVKLAEEDVRKINFYRNKTRSIQKAAAVLVEKHGGRVPETLEELLELPGVGRKTANIIRGNAFGQAAIGVDTHVGRVSQRLGLTTNSDADKIEADLTALVPTSEQVKFCHLMQFHGRRVCTAKKPKCAECAINELCPKVGVK